MPQAKSSYPPDEFDAVDPTAPRSPHRAPKTLAQRLLPFLAAIVLGPILAYVIVTAVETGGLPGARDTTSTQGPAETVTPTSADFDDEGDLTSSAPPETSDEPSDTAPEPTEEPEPTADPDLGTRVMILNSTGTSGLAGRAGTILEEAGWTNVATGNHSGTLPSSVVYYDADDDVLEASARAVAAELGIDTVELDPEAASDPITVVLEADFTP